LCDVDFCIFTLIFASRQADYSSADKSLATFQKARQIKGFKQIYSLKIFNIHTILPEIPHWLEIMIIDHLE